MGTTSVAGSTGFAPRKGTYGIDAPYLLPVAGLLLAGNVVLGIATRSIGPLIGAGAIAVFLSFGLFASRRGKFLVWTELLNALDLRGDERILDMGCGRGAVLLMAAQRLSSGRAVGVDLWKREDQSGNAIEATERNAEAEGVRDRVELRTANMMQLPFPADSFDIILSSLAIHNIKTEPGRERAIDEAIRVLRPGGRILIADIFASKAYESRLRARGVANVSRRNLGWRMWWGGPWMPTHLVTGTK